MTWIEVTDEAVEIEGTRYPKGFRLRLPYRTALPHVNGARARFVEGPHPGRDGEGRPVRPVEPVDWTALEGIGDERAADIEAALAERGVETVEDMLAGDPTELPHVGEAVAEQIEKRWTR